MNYLVIVLLISQVFAVSKICNSCVRLAVGSSTFLYFPGETWKWNYISPKGSQIYFHCTLSLTWSQNCRSERLSVSTTGNTDLKNAQHYCGKRLLRLVSKSNKMHVVYKGSQKGLEYSTFRNCHVFVPPLVDPKKCECGRRNKMGAVQGKERGVNEFPMIAGVMDAIEKQLICGATIITRKFVITAATCVLKKKPKDVELLVGGHDLLVGGGTNEEELLVIDKIIVHPSFDKAKNRNDLALVGVNEMILFNKNVGPVCLPFKDNQKTFVEKKIEAVGWGANVQGRQFSLRLKSNELRIISNNRCKRIHRERITQNQFCTFNASLNSCDGDNGGPLLWTEPKSGRLKLLGILNNDFNCGKLPNINTGVISYLPWIMENVGSDVEYCNKNTSSDG